MTNNVSNCKLSATYTIIYIKSKVVKQYAETHNSVAHSELAKQLRYDLKKQAHGTSVEQKWSYKIT